MCPAARAVVGSAHSGQFEGVETLNERDQRPAATKKAFGLR